MSLVTALRLAVYACAVFQIAVAVRPTATTNRADQKSADVERSSTISESMPGSLVELEAALQEYNATIEGDVTDGSPHADPHKQNKHIKQELQDKVQEVSELLKKMKFMQSAHDGASLTKQRKISMDLEKVRQHIKSTWKELGKAENNFRGGTPGTFEADDHSFARDGHGSPMKRLDGGDEEFQFEDEGDHGLGGGSGGGHMNRTLDGGWDDTIDGHSGGSGSRQNRSAGGGDHARCCRCGPYWQTPFDTAVWSASGECNLQCRQLFHTEPDEVRLPAPANCHSHARMTEHQQRSDCRDECRDVIWRRLGQEEFPDDGPAKCVGSGCQLKVDPQKLDKLFDHAEKWWKQHGDGGNERPSGQCEKWKSNGVCKHNMPFMQKACGGKCEGDGTVDEGGKGTVDEEEHHTVDENDEEEKAVEEHEEDLGLGKPAMTNWNMVFATIIVNTFVLPTLLSMACGTCWCLRPDKVATEIVDSSSD